MGRNRPVGDARFVSIAVPWGANTLELSREEFKRYNTDPDAFAAAHFGLTKIEYLQWLDLEGAPLCGERTKSGDLCRNMTGGYQLKAEEWKARHRSLACVAHGGTPKDK